MKRPILGLLVAAAACKGGGPDLAVPPLEPIVRAATPSALALPQIASRGLMRKLLAAVEGQAYAAEGAPDKSTIDGALRIVFQGTGVATDPPTQGFLIGAIHDVDARKADFDQQALDSKTTCLGRSAATLALSSLQSGLPAPVARFTLNDLRCRSWFQDSAAGMTFGAAITNGVVDSYSIWETPQMSGSADRFGYLVNVDGPEGNDPKVDFLYLEHSASMSPARVMMFRFQARPAADGGVKSFQITMASSAGGVASLQCGFRMKSDGTHIWAEGRHLAVGTDCKDATTFASCYAAGDMRLLDAADCNGMKSFDADITLVDGPSLAGKGAAFSDLLDLHHADGSVDDLD